MQTVSAIATWAVICRTEVPPSPSESTMGRINAADDDAIRTAYSAA